MLCGLGIVLYSQLGSFESNLTMLNTAAISSFSLTIIGLLVVLFGLGFWARRASFRQSLWAGVALGVASFVVGAFSNINVHAASAILMPVVLAGGIGCIVILAMALDR